MIEDLSLVPAADGAMDVGAKAARVGDAASCLDCARTPSEESCGVDDIESSQNVSASWY